MRPVTGNAAHNYMRKIEACTGSTSPVGRSKHARFDRPAVLVVGLFVGLLVGDSGVGGGALMTPLLILVFGVHPAAAVGTDLLYAWRRKPSARWCTASTKRCSGGLWHCWPRVVSRRRADPARHLQIRAFG